MYHSHQSPSFIETNTYIHIYTYEQTHMYIFIARRVALEHSFTDMLKPKAKILGSHLHSKNSHTIPVPAL